MPEAGDIDQPDIERMAAHADLLKEGWQATLADMERMGEELEAEGWRVLTIGAGDTVPEPPDAGRTDRYGLVHVIPGNDADAFREAHENGEFPEYNVYRTQTEGEVFLVTELRDPGTDTAILIAGQFSVGDAVPLMRAVVRTGDVYTHVRKLDATRLGSFEHDGYEKFFPNPERYLSP